jgi:SAM-dependent methyltransferase
VGAVHEGAVADTAIEDEVAAAERFEQEVGHARGAHRDSVAHHERGASLSMIASRWWPRARFRLTGVSNVRRPVDSGDLAEATFWDRRWWSVDKALTGSWAFADSWLHVDQADDPGFFVGVLDGTRAGLLERARHDPAALFAPLNLQAGMRVLDVGCGTGDLLRLLAPLVAPGEAVGIDLSETMIAEARHRHGRQLPNLDFRVGDALALQFDDASFDRVLASQVLLHVPRPDVALGEIARVLDPHGELSLTEIDWGSISIECTDRELSRRFTALACDGLRNGTIVRDLPAMLRGLGFTDIDMRPELAISWEPDAFHTWFVEPSIRHFVRAGAFTTDEAATFLGDLHERAQSGRYFSTRTTYTIAARRPRVGENT